jgi:membrane protein
MVRLGTYAGFMVDLAKKWSAAETSRRAAALAFYAFLALAPLMYIIVWVVGLVFGRAGAQADIVAQVRDAAGPTAASALQIIIENAGRFTTGILGSVGGVILLVLSAAGVYSGLQSDLKVIWEIHDPPRSSIKDHIKGQLRPVDRALTFLALLGTGLLAVLSMVATALVAAFAHKFSGVLPSPTLVLHVADFLVFLGVITLFVALLFRLLPRAPLTWRQLWLGAFFTAFLFSVGKFAIGLYLGRGNMGSSYGAAGGFVVLLLWIYYSAQIFLLGAEFTALRASRARETAAREPAARATHRRGLQE